MFGRLAYVTFAVLVLVEIEWGSLRGNAYEGRLYHGIIREDATDGQEVNLDLPLFVRNRKDNEEVCGYTVYKSGALPIPFQVELLDRKTGSAKIVLSKGSQLDYELTDSYKFEIAADDCETGAHSARDTIHIEIEDANEFAPEWKEPTYLVEAYEGQLYEQLLKLDALDRDGSETFSKICQFHLVTTDVPFTISSQGYLKNTEPLDYSSRHNYILEVTAEDCGHRVSDKVLVNILVKEQCKVGWKGVKDRVEFTPDSGRQAIASNATLELCGSTCELKLVSANIQLQVSELPTACELDERSLETRDKACYISPDTVSLLPSIQDSLTVKDNNGIFNFDGKSVAFEIPALKFAGKLESKFTVSTWLRHEQSTADSEEEKQHILCNADGEGMNRHHYSLFLHNCRLVLLLRREPRQGVDMNVFQPAEWRWRLDEICDGKWHHYSINMDYPQARLIVDGKLFVKSKHNPAVIDDWPLHPSRKVQSTKLVVGACWEGIDKQLGQYLQGQLAGLTILNNATESDQAVHCINSCQEKLDFHAISEMDTGMSISMNSELTELIINGETKESVEKLINRVGYANSRSKLPIESSIMTIETKVMCTDGSNVSVPALSINVGFVEKEDLPEIVLSGTSKLEREEGGISQGEQIFRDILVYAEASKDEESDTVKDDEIPVLNGKYEIDTCIVHVEPSMNAMFEHLMYPEVLIKEHQLKVESTADGMSISGAAKVGDYAEVLREIRYLHKKPEDMNSRKFVVACSGANRQYTSNELVVQLSVIHVDHKPQPEAAHASADKMLHPISNLKSSEDGKSSHGKHQETEKSGAGIVAIVVICICFLMFIIVVGVYRIRSTHQRTVEVNIEEKQEMEWDNSALTITVNPMDSKTVYEETDLNGLHVDETDTDDDIGSFHDDGPDSSDEEASKEKERDLEWDSTTATY